MPRVRFDGARYKEAKVNRYALVQLETNRYSVPTAYVGEKVTLKVTAELVKIIYKNIVIAQHTRLYGRNQDNIILDHYLDLLLQKSRALGNTKVYKPQNLPPIYEEYRRSFIARNSKGNREFVRILMFLREYPAKQVAEAIELAMLYNLYSYDCVLNIIGQLIVTSLKIIPLNKEKYQGISST